jgi:hypothetical protein
VIHNCRRERTRLPWRRSGCTARLVLSMSVECSARRCSAARLTLGWLGEPRGHVAGGSMHCLYNAGRSSMAEPSVQSGACLLECAAGKGAAQCVAKSPVKACTAPIMQVKPQAAQRVQCWACPLGWRGGNAAWLRSRWPDEVLASHRWLQHGLRNGLHIHIAPTTILVSYQTDFASKGPFSHAQKHPGSAVLPPSIGC